MPGGPAGATSFDVRDVVGRDARLAELDRSLTDAVEGRCSVVVLRGEAGIGRSTVVRVPVREGEPRASTLDDAVEDLARSAVLHQVDGLDDAPGAQRRSSASTTSPRRYRPASATWSGTAWAGSRRRWSTC